MSKSNLKYIDYGNVNEMIEGYSNIEGPMVKPHELALANRPLPSTKKCPCLMNGKNDLSRIKPYYDNGEFHGSADISNKEIPVIIKKSRDQYLVLENKTKDYENNDVYIDTWADLPSNKKKDPEKPKMDRVTQFYLGSISIVALFVFFRLIQKSR
jgi:hypothetical protein